MAHDLEDDPLLIRSLLTHSSSPNLTHCSLPFFFTNVSHSHRKSPTHRLLQFLTVEARSLSYAKASAQPKQKRRHRDDIMRH
ncbi:hypothetical protein KIN20_019437 [Parelaphostrongylus tenuis]|uniref:Uncharacterized protein n=1 Tax=Parelaphostrongylus tenuis TaxID=148309 RepID=A0AAD5QSW7_PARTN|nr:hypothetical protein KIN20_019437 [Parelaphostrongylus tenuis]